MHNVYSQSCGKSYKNIYTHTYTHIYKGAMYRKCVKTLLNGT